MRTKGENTMSKKKIKKKRVSKLELAMIQFSANFKQLLELSIQLEKDTISLRELIHKYSIQVEMLDI